LGYAYIFQAADTGRIIAGFDRKYGAVHFAKRIGLSSKEAELLRVRLGDLNPEVPFVVPAAEWAADADGE